jgi:hypothetical protein
LTSGAFTREKLANWFQRDDLFMWTIVPSIFCTIFMVLSFATLISPLSVPGDIGDTRFNLFVLEHVYQWIIGQAPSLRSPGIFYPYPNTLLFSETHAGVAWIYAGLRAIGFNEYAAYTGWFCIGYALTFLTALYALRRMGLRPISATIGAVLFAFNLPMIEQAPHSQLVYRCGVPGAMVYLWSGLRDRSLRDLIVSANWLLFQILVGVYLGVLLFLLMACFVVAWLLLDRRTIPTVLQEWRPASLIAQFRLSDIARTLLFVSLFAAVIILLAQYARVSKGHGFDRNWSEIATMLPQFGSYFILDRLPYWESASRMFKASVESSMLHEHHMFFGIGSLILAFLGLLAVGLDRDFRTRAVPLVSMVSALLILIVLTLRIGDFSFYVLIASLPGFSSVRAVTRIVLIMAFPIAVMAAFGVEFLLRQRRNLIGVIVISSVFAFTGFEVASSTKVTTSFATLENRISPIVEQARIARGDRPSPILAFNGAMEEPIWAIELDAMLAAQRLGWRTFNGYSGFLPPGSEAQACIRPAEQVQAARERGGKLAMRLAAEDPLGAAVFVGPMNCEIFSSLQLMLVRVQAPLSRPTISTDIKLDLTLMNQTQNLISVSAVIRNEGSSWLLRNHPGPTRLSWRFVPLDQATAHEPPAFDNRLDIMADVPPNGAQINLISAKLPSAPGRYRFEVSLLAELKYWFHDQGMEIATLSDVLTVP